MNKAIAHIRFVREVGQAIVPFALVACMAIGIRQLTAASGYGNDKLLDAIRDMLAPMESRMRAVEIRTGALEQAYGERVDE